MITLTDIAYVRSGVADLEAATRFATGIVGLELAEPTEPGVSHLRADHRHHCLALVQGPSGVISSGFTVPVRVTFSVPVVVRALPAGGGSAPGSTTRSR